MKEKESCCCHEKENEIAQPKIEEESCCCHSETKTEPKQENKEESCCCHNDTAASLEKPEKKESGCCCHSQNAETEQAEQKAVKAESTSCCCHSGGKSEAGHGGASCCGVAPLEKSGRMRYIRIAFLIISFVSLVASFIMSYVAKHGELLHYLDFGFIAVALCGVPIVKSAVTNLIKGKGSRKITSSLLISTAMISCIVVQILMWTNTLHSGEGHSHSYIFAAGEVAWLMAIGAMIEDFTVKKARAGIEKLISIAPSVAKYRVNGEIIEKPLSEVRVGDVVIILPDDIISVDGEIISGTTAVDEAVVTGESVPKDKSTGDLVFAGTWNKFGAIEVRVTKAEDDMTINKLRKLVEEAEGKKAPISKLADKFASIIVPSAVLLSILIFLVNYFVLLRGATSSERLVGAIINGVTLLIVFCPCALALATPTAVAAGLGNSARNGILVKSGGALETLAKVDTIAFDKTGTLTMGNIAVDKVISYGIAESELLFLTGSAESFSEHPVAKAIAAYAKSQVELATPENTRSITGIGVEAQVGDKKVLICKWENLNSSHAGYDSATKDAQAMLDSGRTVVACVAGGELKGLISLRDELREGARECIGILNSRGYRTAMLTGDNEFVAKDIAAQTGLKEAFSSLMPEDKLTKIEELKSGNHKVCMVGDGINDAPALAASDCSIAMGALGNDIAIETAEIALMTSDIKKIPSLLQLSRKMLRKIKINITISMTINFISVILSMFGILNPILGAMVHNASSILVVLNSALLLRHKYE